MESEHNCTNCQADFPRDATFCPYCGTQPAPFNKTLVGNFLLEPSASDTMTFDPVDFRPGRGYGVKLFIGVAITAAVIAGVFVGSWLANMVNRPLVVPQAAVVAEPAAEVEAPAPVVEITVSSNAGGSFDIMRGAEIMHTVNTSVGSRYSSLDERMRSVAVRFKHVESKAEGRFSARLVGDHHELVWADDNGAFRLLDITPNDVKGSEASTDFVANYLADRLNADLPQQPPNS